MEPVTLAVVAGAVLTGGVQFLYGQVDQLLRRRWEAHAAGRATTDAERAVAELPAAYFGGDLGTVIVDEDRFARVEEQLTGAWEGATRYGSGARPVDPNDREALVRVNALREALEAVVGRPITFQGEERPQAVVRASLNIDSVAGEATGVAVDKHLGGSIDSRGTIGRVEPGGKVVGVDIGQMGNGPTGSTP